MLLSLGNIGYQVGAAGIVSFAVIFLIVVRWWTDHLGRVIAGTLFAMASVLVMTTIRMMAPHLQHDPGFLTVRAVVFWVFGLGIWTALGSFVWAQFFAPRIRQSGRMTTRKENRDEEGNPSGSGPHPDGDLHDRAGVHD